MHTLCVKMRHKKLRHFHCILCPQEASVQEFGTQLIYLGP